jgi:tetratricopeptide (TPR) repeat protein
VRRRRETAFAAAAALAALLFAAALPRPARADLLDDLWRRGNDAYLRGDYPAAVAAYEQIDRQGVIAADLELNLGNAYYRRGDLGRAIWRYERALSLDADADDARFNLEQARKIAGRRVRDKIEGADREPFWIRAVSQLSASTETWLFVASYLLLFAALGLRLHARRTGAEHAPVLGALAAILGVAAAASGLLLLGRVALDRAPFAIVLPDAVAAKEGADPEYRTSFDVHAGLRVRLVDRDRDWVRVRLANGLEGWVRSADVGRI